MTPLTMKGWKFRSVLGTHGPWALTVFDRFTNTGRRDVRKYCQARTRDAHTCSGAFDGGAVTTWFNNVWLSRSGIKPWYSSLFDASTPQREPQRHFINDLTFTVKCCSYILFIDETDSKWLIQGIYTKQTHSFLTLTFITFWWPFKCRRKDNLLYMYQVPVLSFANIILTWKKQDTFF